MKRVLVTGGAGFLGRHLCARLLALGDHVVCVDNFFTGSEDNIRGFMADQRFELVRHDVCQPLHLEVDEIYNLACPASPVYYQRDPINTLRTNVNGAHNVLRLASRLRTKVLQASTSEVYGDPVIHPQVEDYWGHVNPIGVRSCYDEGKRCAETLFFDYHRLKQVRIKLARIFNTYGPYMQCHDGRVVSNFVLQALKNEPITLYGRGTQTRSFCYVTDLVDALFALMGTDDDLTGPMNLGNPEEISILDLARLVRRLSGSRSRLVFKPLPGDDPRQRKPDITMAKEALGWTPRIGIEEGLLKTIAYFDNVLTGRSGAKAIGATG